jgi:4-carboxymuconolactone decarboxylase
MPRFPAANRDSVPQDQVAAFDAIVSARNNVVPEQGPIAVQLHVPEIAQRGEVLRAYLRADGSSLLDNVAELAMLTTARELDCQFIWHAHAAAGRRSGLSDALVDSLRDKTDLPELSSAEAAVINYGREFFRTRRVSQATFDAALAEFGERGLIELTNLMGYYSVLAFNINAFEQLPPASDEPFLPV